MAVIVNGDGILTGVSSLTTALDDLTSGRGTVTGVATVGTLQLGTGVSISSPRSQNAAIFTNNTEFLTVDDAGRVGIAITNPTTKFDVNGTSKFQDDVTFTGASANIIFDKSVDDLIFNDGTKAVFGTGNDLAIYHNSSDGHSYISHEGATGGDLIIQTTGSDDDVFIKCNDDFIVNVQNGNENAIIARNSGAVELYYNNSKKFHTYDEGCSVFGNLNLEDSTSSSYGRLRLGNSSDLQIYHDGNHSRIKTDSSATGNLVIDSNNDINLRVNNSEMAVHCHENGAVELYYNNSKKMETNDEGVKISGFLEMEDNQRIQMGSGDDLQIYHDGSTSYIRDTGTGNLRLTTSKGEFRNAADTQTLAAFIESGAVELYHNATKQCETSSNGLAFPNGKGIDFSATGNAGGMTSELLDDYEEGSWTPTARNDGSFTSPTGRYVKIGQQVTVWAYIPTVTNNTSNNSLQISGLPFTATSSGHTEFVGSLMIRFVTAVSGINGVSFNTYIASGRDYVEMYACRDDGNNFEVIKHSDLAYTNSNGIRFCISYVA